MKTRCIPLWLSLLGLLCIGQFAHAQLPAGINGAWYNPAQSGHGLSVEMHSSTRAIVFWMVYDPDGNPIHLFIDGHVGQRAIAGRAYLSRGMRFGSFDRSNYASELWGEIALQFEDCNTAELHYDANGPAGAGYGEGSLPLRRLIGLSGQGCNFDLQMVGLFDGAVTDPDGRTAPVVGLFGDDGEVTLSVDEPPFGNPPRAMLFKGSQPSRPQLAGQPVELQLTAAHGRDAPPAGESDWVLPLLGSYSAQLRLQLQPDGSRYKGALELGDGRAFAVDLAPRQLLSDWLNGSFPAAYRRTLSLSNLAGSYWQSNASMGGQYYELDFSLSPAVGGDNFAGSEIVDLWSPPGVELDCHYRGGLYPRTGLVVEIEVDVTVSNCGARNGRYVGRGWFEDRYSPGDNQTLEIMAFGNEPGQGLRLTLFRRQ